MANYTTGRHRYARGPVTDSVKLKLIERLQAEQDLGLLAEDIIEMIAVGRNDPDWV